jgi:hypothetical protein
VVLSQDVRLDPKAVGRAKQYEKYFSAAAEKYGVDARLLWVIGYLETRFNPKAVSRKGARGLMQLMPATAARFGASDPNDPIAAIDAAARYLRYLSTRFDRRLDLILAAYNAGEGAVDAYRMGRSGKVGSKIINPSRRLTSGIPPYLETINYVKDGLSIHGLIAGNTTSIRASRITDGEDNQQNPSPNNKSIIYIPQTHPQDSSQTKSSNRRSIIYSRTVELP